MRPTKRSACRYRPEAYLDQAAILAAAKESGAELIHPGYGFLSENAEFARACAVAGYTFVGPDADVLELVGNKSVGPRRRDRRRGAGAGRDRGPEQRRGRPRVLRRPGRRDHDQGARGRRRPRHAQGATAPIKSTTPTASAPRRHNSASAIRRCSPRRFSTPRGTSRCRSWPRRPGTRRMRSLSATATAASSGAIRSSSKSLPLKVFRIPCAATCTRPRPGCAPGSALHGLATVEFLVTGEEFVFLEVNPRIQVEHTVTEEVTGVDLVAVQLAIAGGASYYQLGLPAGIASDGTEVIGEPAARRGIAIQARVNMETFAADGSVVPAAGTLTVFSPPSGPGVRVDTYGRPGLTPSPRYDSLLAKVDHPRAGIVVSRRRCARRGPRWPSSASRASRTNIEFLRELLSDSADSVGHGNDELPRREASRIGGRGAVAPARRCGSPRSSSIPGEEVLRAQLAGTVVEVAPEGAEFGAGGQLVVLEAMKMQHVLVAPDALRTVRNLVTPGQVVGTGDPLVVFTRTGSGGDGESRCCRNRSRPTARRPRRGPASATCSPSTRAGKPPLPSGTSKVAAPRGRTSPTWSMPAASSSTARWPSPRSAAGAPRRT